MKAAFVGGALSFKGDKKKAKKKKQKTKHESKSKDREGAADDSKKKVVQDLEEELTEAEKKAMRHKKEREINELAVMASKSHRERVEEFNEKLGKLTEHNDIPRVCITCVFEGKKCH